MLLGGRRTAEHKVRICRRRGDITSGWPCRLLLSIFDCDATHAPKGGSAGPLITHALILLASFVVILSGSELFTNGVEWAVIAWVSPRLRSEACSPRFLHRPFLGSLLKPHQTFVPGHK